nr:EexN family lipoprotein [uncultured Pseudomonas sp.]
MNKFFAVMIAVTSLIGCKESTPVQTVEWYTTHDAERLAMIEKCKNNPGELELSANCVNAQAAADKKDLSRRGWIRPSVESAK